MIKRTHLALGCGLALYFLPHVKDKLIFFLIVLISSLLPNIGEISSLRKGRDKQGKSTINRGILHTYTLCILISILLTFFYPIAALPFFIGYSFHLTLDSFTSEGIQPFWPFKKRIHGKISAGGRIDKIIFYIFSLVDIALLIKLFL